MSDLTRNIARAILAAEPVFLDTETTGLGSTDEVIELGIVDMDGTVLLSTLVRPTIPIPAEATAIHGITNEMVADAPTIADLHEQLQALMADRLVVIYNADYDLRMLKQSSGAHGLESPGLTVRWWCAMRVYAEHAGEWNHKSGSYRWHKLAAACQREGVELPAELHRAVADAEATRRLLVKMALPL
jgi:DNA polymerase-3 subunit epsilon